VRDDAVEADIVLAALDDLEAALARLSSDPAGPGEGRRR
jgi:hypothetical protein